MSFECEGDKALLRLLNEVHDKLPVGESQWIIVNRNSIALAATVDRIQKALPGASVQPVAATFREWLKLNMPELQAFGAVSL